VYWLCHVFGEPGVETTPFADATGSGWEDDLARPRSADGSSARCRRPGRLCSNASRLGRPTVLMRLITHDAFHTGEISLTLGNNGLPAIEPWVGLSRVVR
jgi:hypothetical protein